ncbi:MAG TPA: thioredoxin domain-containing protein [Propionibacteriaceae bacterium]|nr:thioredoxin domain-containing protein [Propionibacteriaceae bacterium]
MSGSNRLATATSPYLLQHADNPVHWWPWCDEAFDEAAARDVPVFLSVGYAACHWCHVMAHESFEDPQTAMFINDHFVAIKVDREERPDVDAVYMQATQAITGQGGWPMTVFLTPDRRPFYAGTYFPPAPRHGMPSFTQVAMAVAAAWRDRRTDVLESAGKIVDQLANLATGAGGSAEINIAAVIGNLRRSYDAAHGGFGGAPKFPPSMVLEALLRHGGDEAMIMVDQTCDAMARGGICDQLGGGFARYSVDARWVVPHFEKMLYDNALLLGVYTHWWRLTETPLARRVVHDLLNWLLRELATDEGGFAASLDADSLDEHGRHREGAFYAWNREQLTAALGPDDGLWAADTFSVTEQGTFEDGLSTLQLLLDPRAQERLADVRARLFAFRERRPRPTRDDKVVVAWNGWLISSMIDAAMIFDQPPWLESARTAGELLWRVHWVDSRLRRTSRGGQVGSALGILEDYAALIQAYVRLAAATAEPVWLERARQLHGVIASQFDDGNGGFFDTAADAEQLYARPQDPTDNATPSGLSATVHALRLLSQLTGDDTYADRAAQAAATGGQLIVQAPRFAGWLLADVISYAGDRPPVQVAIVGRSDDPIRAELVRTAYQAAPAGSVILAGEPDQASFALLADRPLIEGRPTAYVCQHFVCKLPVTSAADLAAQLAS